MKAIVYEGIQKVQCREVPDPKIEKEDDIIIKVTSTAICGSDLHLVHGLVKGMYDGFILGHETMGIVEEVGKEVKNLKKGDRVIVPFPVSCGHCFYCEHNEFSQCDNTNEYGEAGGLLGYSKSYGDYAGGQAEYLRVPHAKTYGAEIVNFEQYDETGAYIKEITSGGADCVIDCVGLDGKMSLMEKVETALKLQGGSKSAIEIASQAVRKCGHDALVGVYGTKYNNFPLGNFFTRNITLKMGQCPATRYVKPILEKIKNGEFDETDIITHRLSLEQGRHAYEIFDAKEDNCIQVVLKP